MLVRGLTASPKGPEPTACSRVAVPHPLVTAALQRDPFRTVTTGCSGPFPTAATGASPLLIAADTRTGTLYVTDFSSASVTVLNGSQCNAAFTGGCGNATREQAVGSGPFGLAVNPATSTVYVANGYLPGSMSIFAATRW